MPSVSVMFKPSSAVCNLACEYCFYHSLAKERESFSYGFMPNSTFEIAINKIFDYANGDPIYLTFQGGEPLLLGIDFFKKAFAYIKENNIKKSQVTLCVQTNGVLINDDFARLFLDNNVLLGVSLDGGEAQNRYRKDKDGMASFNKVLDALKILSYYQVDFNILSVVTNQNANKIGEIIDFFASRGYRYLQFIPCLKPFHESENVYLNAESYQIFLTQSLLKYREYLDNGNYVSIRHLDNMVRLVCGDRTEQCGMNGKCAPQMVVEGDGSVFPCDFYCLDEYLLGNLKVDSIEKIIGCMHEFQTNKMENECTTCTAFALCRGGCKRERSVERCKALREFAPNAIPVLRAIGKKYL